MYALNFQVVTATGTVDEVTAEAGKEIGKNAREIGGIFQEIGKLQNRLYPVEKQIRGESQHTTNEVTEKNQETLNLINNIDKPDCRVKAKKELESAFTQTKADILECQQDTIHKMNDLEHDLKETQKSLKQLKKTNGKIIKNCYRTTNRQADELEQCFKAKDNDVKVEIKKEEEKVNTVKDKITDIDSNTVIKCIQTALPAFNKKTDQIVIDVKKCGGVE